VEPFPQRLSEINGPKQHCPAFSIVFASHQVIPFDKALVDMSLSPCSELAGCPVRGLRVSPIGIIKALSVSFGVYHPSHHTGYIASMGRFLNWWLKSNRNSGTNSKLENEYANNGASDDASETIPRRKRKWSTTATVGKPRSRSPNRTSIMSADPTPARTPSPFSSSACSRSSRKKSCHNTSTEAVVEWHDQALRNSRNANTTTSSVTRVSFLLKKHKLALVIPSLNTPVRAGDSPLSSAGSTSSEKGDLMLGEELVLSHLEASPVCNTGFLLSA
jgi:hypothetical protein